MDLENQRDDDETFCFDSNRSLTKCATTMPTLEFKHHWEIAQFSVHQEISSPGDCVSGSRFGDDDHEFMLKLFPTGKDDDCSGYLSLFLQISKCPMPKLQFRVNFIIDTMDGPRGCALNKAVVTINRGGIVTASKFFSIEQLKARNQRYLPNDVLRIVTEMTVYGEPNSYSVDPLDDTFPELASTSSLTNSRLSLAPITVDLFKEASLEKLLYDSALADFKVHVEEPGERKTFRLHKAILAARSAYFEGLLKAGNKEFEEGKVVIKDVSIAVMTKVIHFMYTMKVPELDEFTPDVIYAADRFLVQPLKNCLMACLGRNITVDNVFSRLEMSYRLSDDRVFKKAAVLFARNRSTLTASEDWMRLKKQWPMLATEILEAAYDDGDTSRLNTSTNKRRRTSS